jgi:hypothetical protein
VGSSTAYRRRSADPAFAEAWENALRGTDVEDEPAALQAAEGKAVIVD